MNLGPFSDLLGGLIGVVTLVVSATVGMGWLHRIGAPERDS